MTTCAAGAALVLAPAAWADGAGPTGQAGGWHSPVEGVLQLTVKAGAAEGATLGNATIMLNGTPVADGPLCPGTDPCTRTDGAGVPLSFDTSSFPDGTYRLQVTVADADGATTTVLDEPTEIWNDRPQYTSTATLTIGSGVPAPQPLPGPGAGGGVLGASAGSCVKPKLSMRLSERPVRVQHGVPVLKRWKRYRFTGRLTCLRNGKRHSAPKRTRIDVRARFHHKWHRKARPRVRSHGRIVVRIRSHSRRTLEFRFKTPDKKVTRVRIKVRTVSHRHYRRHHHKSKHAKH